MATNAVHVIESDSVAKLVPGGAPALARLSDDELLANTRRLVGKSNQLLAALLVHLAEAETRGAHRTRRCASLYTYCIYELRFSEDAAARRSAAARFVKEFPVLLDAIADGELHLTGLLMIGPHLTLENHVEVLGRAKFRTKKELAKLIRDLHPLPGVPDSVQPLGPEPPRALRAPSWAEYVESLSPTVRELPEGERPRDWVDGRVDDFGNTENRATDVGANDEALPVGPVPADLAPVTKPQHYQVQFSTTEEHAQLIERAKDLLARERPTISLGELHLKAMKLLVASLEKRKFAVGAQPRSRPSAVTPRPNAPVGNDARRLGGTGQPPRPGDPPHHGATHEPPRQRDTSESLRQRGTSNSPRQRGTDQPPRQRGTSSSPRQRGTDQPPRQRGTSSSPHKSNTHEPPRQRGTDQPPRQRGTSNSPRQRGTDQPPRQRGTSSSPHKSNTHEPPRQRGTDQPPRQPETAEPPSQRHQRRQRPARDADDDEPNGHTAEPSRRPNRYIPAAQRREVYGRDGGRCGHVDARGERCHETRCLEIHHLKPFAMGGTHEVSNLALRCHAHNDLAAEEDFGRELIAGRRDSARHDSLVRQLRTPRGD